MATAFSSGLSSDLAGGADTIVALATGPGRGALAIIRLSGRGVIELAATVCPQVDFGRPREAKLTPVLAAGGERLETGVAVPYLGPRSFTGENMLELTIHGSPYLAERVVEEFVAGGARPAGPGEFTRRAVANGKLDLVQAEAIRDLVAADTAWQLHNARQQLAGELSTAFSELRATLVTLLATADAAVDYEAQGVVVTDEQLEAAVAASLEQVQALLATATAGERLRGGTEVTILGPPNAGKSTLFNALCGKSRAIVSPRPGTTRDAIEAELDLGGVPVTLTDTAGLRAPETAIEAEAGRRALAAAAAADLVVWLQAVDDEPTELPPVLADEAEVVKILSKSDLAPGEASPAGWMRLSCRTGEGLDELRRLLTDAVAGGLPDLGGRVAIASRHRAALMRAAGELEGCPVDQPELLAEGARWARRAVDEILGEISNDDILDEVYQKFCIGK
jgi:tRNA modification GTPase